MSLRMPQRYIDPQVGDHFIRAEVLAGRALVDVQAPVVGEDQLVTVFQVDVLKEREPQIALGPGVQTAKLEALVVGLAENDVLGVWVHKSYTRFPEEGDVEFLKPHLRDLDLMYQVEKEEVGPIVQVIGQLSVVDKKGVHGPVVEGSLKVEELRLFHFILRVVEIDFHTPVVLEPVAQPIVVLGDAEGRVEQLIIPTHLVLGDDVFERVVISKAWLFDVDIGTGIPFFIVSPGAPPLSTLAHIIEVFILGF